MAPAAEHTAATASRVSELCTKFGVDQRLLRQIDGSGLSKQNLICPRACVQLLQVTRQIRQIRQIRQSFICLSFHSALIALYEVLYIYMRHPSCAQWCTYYLPSNLSLTHALAQCPMIYT